MADTVDSHLKVARWAQQHAGVFTRRTAHDLGMTEYQFRRGVQRGQWLAYRGVWQLVGMPDTEISRLWAALLRAGKHAFATGPSALALFRLDVSGISAGSEHSTGQRVYLSTPTNSHLRIPGVVALREVRPAAERNLVDGVPTVSRHRALIDTVRLIGWSQSKTAVFRGIQLGWASPESFASAVTTLAGCRGNTQLRIAARDLTSGSHSEAERLAHRAFTRAGLCNFAANLAVYDRHGLIGYVDIAFVEGQVAIEIDGRAWHSDAARRQHDQSRQNRLANAGWLVLRFTWEDVSQRPRHVAETVKAALARRRSG